MSDRLPKRVKPSAGQEVSSRKADTNARTRAKRGNKARLADTFAHDDSDLTTLTGLTFENKSGRMMSTQTSIILEPPAIAIHSPLNTDWNQDSTDILPSNCSGVPVIASPSVSIDSNKHEPVSIPVPLAMYTN
jgi:hypothetical protein